MIKNGFIRTQLGWWFSLNYFDFFRVNLKKEIFFVEGVSLDSSENIYISSHKTEEEAQKALDALIIEAI
jgi:hypothetical protein